LKISSLFICILNCFNSFNSTVSGTCLVIIFLMYKEIWAERRDAIYHRSEICFKVYRHNILSVKVTSLSYLPYFFYKSFYRQGRFLIAPKIRYSLYCIWCWIGSILALRSRRIMCDSELQLCRNEISKCKRV